MGDFLDINTILVICSFLFICEISNEYVCLPADHCPRVAINSKKPSASYPAKGFIIIFILFCHLFSVFFPVVYVEVLISLGDEVILPHLLEYSVKVIKPYIGSRKAA